MKKLLVTAMAVILSLSTAACSLSSSQSFAEAHDAFETNITTISSDQDEIPSPPEGVFELDYYSSTVGELAAYVSSDPGDGELHPMIIWVVGGWSNGIDEFPWSYPEWENDQTGSAFREAGVLMMYPSFRGANGNPGNYESLFGEIDDIAAAYEYAAALPYVDTDRIYLGGHSTGGTRALLAAEYTDKFRAVFAFGPVDYIQYHNTSQFTFDTSNNDEYKMRSPIYWLEDIQTPTFIIEGEDGNSERLLSIDRNSKNDNIHCYVIDDADHFTVLAPVTRLLAQKVLADSGTEVNITLTDEELAEAMLQPEVVSYPLMESFSSEEVGFSMQVPVIWEAYDQSEDGRIMLAFASPYEDDNFWDASMLYVDVYTADYEVAFDDFQLIMSSLDYEFQYSDLDAGGNTFYVAEATLQLTNSDTYAVKTAAVQNGSTFIEFWFYTPEQYLEVADPMFLEIIETIKLQ